MLPKGWKIKTIGDIARIRHGRDQKKIISSEGKYPILGTGGEMGRTDSYLYNKPSVLIGRKGTIDKPRFMDTPFWTVDTLFYTELSEEIIPKWLFYYFETINWYEYNEASGVPSLSASTISNIEIKVPSKPEQEKIALILNTCDEIIEKTSALINKNEIKKKSLENNLLTGKIRFKEFENTEWNEVSLSEVAWYQEGPGLRTSQFTKHGIKVINITNIVDGVLDLSKTDRHISLEEFNKTYKHFEIQAEDIVIASSGNSYCKHGIVRECDLPLVMNTSVIRFKPLEGCDYNYLNQFLKSPFLKQQIDVLITGGAQPNFGPIHLAEITIPFPSIKEQKRIAIVLSTIDEEIFRLKKQLEKLKQQKKGLMKLILTGRVRVI